MQAIIIEEFGGPEKLKLAEVATPQPGPKEVRIQVAYAGVNPVDWKIRNGGMTRLPHAFPIILGWDASGVVDAIGEEVKNLKIGDAVFAYLKKPLIQWGSYAEYVTYDAAHVVKKPVNLSFAEAAAIPLVGLTAWQALFDKAALKRGETVLIMGASGGVGSLGVQFAKYMGATVFATASAKKHDYVKRLGADLVVDYRDNFVQHIKMHAKSGVDVVADFVGGEMFRKGMECLKKGGRLVSLLENLDPREEAERQIHSFYVFVAPNGEELKKIASLLEEKKIVPPPIVEMPLKEAAKAQQKLEKGEVFGKITLKC